MAKSKTARQQRRAGAPNAMVQRSLKEGRTVTASNGVVYKGGMSEKTNRPIPWVRAR